MCPEEGNDVKRVHIFAATVPAALGVAVPTAIGLAMPGVAAAATVSDKMCNNTQNSTSCVAVHGSGLFVSNVKLVSWPNSNGGLRHGYLGWTNLTTGRYVSQWHVASESRPKPDFYNFSWTLNCYMPNAGYISGRVGGHPGTPAVHVYNGRPTTPHCTT